MAKHQTTRVGAVLADVLASLDVRDRLREYRVWQVWEATVGKILASRTEPVRIENGRLIVRVADSVWMQELQFMKDDLRRKLNRAVGEQVVRSIFLVQGTINPRPEKGPERPEFDVDDTLVEKLLPPEVSPEIAEALRRVARARLRRFGALEE